MGRWSKRDTHRIASNFAINLTVEARLLKREDTVCCSIWRCPNFKFSPIYRQFFASKSTSERWGDVVSLGRI